jgi:hypothetical protein
MAASVFSVADRIHYGGSKGLDIDSIRRMG